MTRNTATYQGKRRKPWVPILLGVLAAAVLGGVAWMALGAPAEEPEDTLPIEEVHTPDGVMPEAPVDDTPVDDTPVEPEPEPEPEPEEPPFEPLVAESEPVEDTYFDDVVFLGDSRTEGLYLYSGIKNGKFLYGTGATVESVFSKDAWETGKGKVPLLDALTGMECGKIYLMLGVNELGWVKTETFRDQYTKVIDRVRADHPEAKIVLQTILPVSAEQEAKKTYVNNSRIQVYNDIIKELAAEKECYLVDTAEATTDENGFMRAEWAGDGIHPNRKGYQAWLEYLRTHSV